MEVRLDGLRKSQTQGHDHTLPNSIRSEISAKDVIIAMMTCGNIFSYQFCKSNGDPLDSAERFISVGSRSQYFIIKCVNVISRGIHWRADAQTSNSDYLYVPNIPQEIGSNYIIKKELGKGAYGTVYLAVSRQTGEEYGYGSFVEGIELQLSGSTTCFEQRRMPSERFERLPFFDSAITRIFAN